jgi:hypothetical protein
MGGRGNCAFDAPLCNSRANKDATDNLGCHTFSLVAALRFLHEISGLAFLLYL